MRPASSAMGMPFWPAWPPEPSDFGDVRERHLAKELQARRPPSRARLLPVLVLGLAVIGWHDAAMAVTTVGLLVALVVGAWMRG